MKKIIFTIAAFLVSVTIYSQTDTLNFDQPFGTQSWSEDGYSWSWDNSGWDNIRNYHPHTGSGNAMTAPSYSSKLSEANHLLNIYSIWVMGDNTSNYSYLKIYGYNNIGAKIYTANLNPSDYNSDYAKVILNWYNVKSIQFDFALIDDMMPGNVSYDDMVYSIACSSSHTISDSIFVKPSLNGQFTASNLVAGTTYQWQSKPAGYDWVNTPNNSTYSGSATGTITINNVKISNHLQPFRLISTNGTCTDTSNVGFLVVTDTCITSKITNISVTDTLIINAVLTGITPPNNINKIKVYPNPASTYIFIDNGNYSSMNGYTIKIENNLGQSVFQSAINQKIFSIDLSTWTGSGIYFLYVKDNLGNTIDTRKIVIK